MTNNITNNPTKKTRRRRRALDYTLRGLMFVGATLLFYVVCSLLIDTPVEREMKRSTARLEEQYEALSNRYDSLTMVLENMK